MLIFGILFNVEHVVLWETNIVPIEPTRQRVCTSSRVHLGWRVESMVIDSSLVTVTKLVKFFEIFKIHAAHLLLLSSSRLVSVGSYVISYLRISSGPVVVLLVWLIHVCHILGILHRFGAYSDFMPDSWFVLQFQRDTFLDVTPCILWVFVVANWVLLRVLMHDT